MIKDESQYWINPTAKMYSQIKIELINTATVTYNM